ncbi:hypothetical protein SY83_13050 [Paenibacillus swuensis]|uniref:Sec-independent protein translocase protein TatA n=1 Tax=Paenibacillus swuensis TaxID=1178515 RepID=A0A172TJA2_9BACL|nr:twin-arginine translocase TatA/TatE family subunit [Paenibacillus swuensis]ANE47042.1 hypothetical protein SY83_13050 [Paenibacillus swuensis]
MGLNSIGPTGFILLVVIALLLFGPNKLPELGRAFGRTLREFKQGAKDMMSDDDDKPRRQDITPGDAGRLDAERKDDNRRLPE